MAENLPRYAVTDLIARVSGMSRGRLEMRLLGECAEVSRFMPCLLYTSPSPRD